MWLRIPVLGLVMFLFWNCVPGQEYGVWVATAHRIDFPKTDGRTHQQAELRELVRIAAERHITTIYFQVRARGDAFFESTLEPWSPHLRGPAGEEPGWDPLAELIREAQRHGMKVSAWFNTFLVADRSTRLNGTAQERHPLRRHPEWRLAAGPEIFLDPGIPAVREYLAAVAADLARKYPLDGFQLDFLRYPTRSFDDSATMVRYKPDHLPAADWRRQNITAALTAIRQSVKAVRPRTRFGVTSLGICKRTARSRGLESYHEVFQDGCGWLEQGLLDEIAPQIYWTIGTDPEGPDQPPSPDFTDLLQTWRRLNADVRFLPGIGLYKPQIFREAAFQVAAALSAGADGVIFYSWTHFLDLPFPLLTPLPAHPPRSWHPLTPPAADEMDRSDRVPDQATTGSL
ncbi:MAG: family 10 glycosylhydrolase [Acidobacteria bacterium]|nr:family 10 glycosylhydrolase [Acidobacteriota bacterium]